MERDLRRLGDGAAEETERDERHDGVGERACLGRVEHGAEVEASPTFAISEEEARAP